MHKRGTRPLLVALFLWFAASCGLTGCVRVAGTAGYWHAGQDGDMEAKSAGFDTNSLAQKGKTPGSITL